MSAVPKTADTTVVIEGTARTVGDDSHHLWQQATDPACDSPWQGLFIGWWEHPDNVMPLPVSREQFANTLTREERELMERFHLTLEQLDWRTLYLADGLSRRPAGLPARASGHSRASLHRRFAESVAVFPIFNACP